MSRVYCGCTETLGPAPVSAQGMPAGAAHTHPHCQSRKHHPDVTDEETAHYHQGGRCSNQHFYAGFLIPKPKKGIVMLSRD